MLPNEKRKYKELYNLITAEKLNIKEFKDAATDKLKFLDIRVLDADRLSTFKRLSSLIETKLKIKVVRGTGGRANKDFTLNPDKINSPYNKFRILIKPEKGSKPQDNDHETLSAYCTAQAMTGSKDFSEKALSQLKNVDGVSLKDAYKKCGVDWLESSIIHGEFLAKKYSLNGGYFFLQRGGRGKAAWVDRLYKRFAVLKKKLGVNLNADKWDPADMWIVHNDCLKDDFTSYISLKELNAYLVKKFVEKKIIGVSLKKCKKGKAVKHFIENVSSEPREIKNVKVNRGKVLTKYSNITFDLVKGTGSFTNFDMAIRPFTNEESSGELKGSGSLAGKVGITEINRLLKEVDIQEIERKPILVDMYKNKNTKFFELFFQRFKPPGSDNNKLNKVDDLINEVTKLGDDVEGYYMGKFQAVSLCYIFDTVIKKEKIRNEVMMGMYAYASSTTELSGPFIKISN